MVGGECLISETKWNLAPTKLSSTTLVYSYNCILSFLGTVSISVVLIFYHWSLFQILMYQCCWWSLGNCCDTDNYFRLLSIIWTAVVIVMMMILFWWQSQMKNKRFKKYEMMKVWEKLHQQVTLVWMTMKTMKVLLWLRQWRWSVPRNKTDPRCAGLKRDGQIW